MKTLKQLERLRNAHKLIKQGSTGSPSEFSDRLHISERELYRVLDYLKEMDAEIIFSRTSNTYYYSGDFDLLINVSVKALVNQELITIYAGRKIKNEYLYIKNNGTDTPWHN